MQKLQIISDIDEVIVRCDLKWIDKIKRNSKKLGVDYNDPRLSEPTISLRPIYHIDKFLELSTDKLPLFKSLYYEDPSFYDDIPLTPVGKVIQFLSNKKEYQIVFISVSKGGSSAPVALSKIRYIENNFNIENCVIHLVEEDKSQIVKNNYPNWTYLYEDNIVRIHDILKVSDLNSMRREVLVPVYGWNIESSAVQKLLEDTQTSLMYYYGQDEEFQRYIHNEKAKK